MMTKLTVAMGSLETASNKFSELNSMSNKLGLTTQTLALSYSKFKIAADLAGSKAKDTEKIFKAVATAGAAIKLSNEEVNGTFKALEQMLSKGNVQAEELRGQLSERLPGAFSMAAKAMGVTTAELGKMLERGEVAANDLLPKLADVLQNEFAEGAKKAANSIQASFNRIENGLLSLKKAFSNTDFGNRFGNSMTLFSSWADELERSKRKLNEMDFSDLQLKIGELKGEIQNVENQISISGAKFHKKALELKKIELEKEVTMYEDQFLKLQETYKKNKELEDKKNKDAQENISRQLKIDNEKRYIQEMENVQSIHNLKMKELRAELTASKMDSDKIDEIINKKNLEFKKLQDEKELSIQRQKNESLLREKENFLVKKKELLRADKKYLLAIGEDAAAAEKEIELYKFQLKSEGFIEGSLKYKTLINQKKSELFDAIENQEKDAAMRQINILIDKYRAMGEIEKAAAVERSKVWLEREDKGFTDQENTKAQANDEKIANSQKSNNVVSSSEEAKRIEIKKTMSVQEAANAAMINAHQEMEERILSSSELTADVVGKSMSFMNSGLENFFDASSSSFMDLKELGKSVVTSLLSEIATLMAKQAAAQAMSGLMSSFGGGIGSLLGGLFANGGAFNNGVQMYANGGAFNNGVEKFASGGAFTNTVAKSTTVAPMAMFGEAGPEAIMPLSRDSSGKLGVSLNSDATKSNGNVMVSTQIIINNNAPVSIEESEDSNGNKILTIEEIDSQLASKMRSGDCKTSKVMENKYPSLKRV